MSELLKQLSIRKTKNTGEGMEKETSSAYFSMIRDHQESHTRDLDQSFCVHFSQDEVSSQFFHWKGLRENLLQFITLGQIFPGKMQL